MKKTYRDYFCLITYKNIEWICDECKKIREVDKCTIGTEDELIQEAQQL